MTTNPWLYAFALLWALALFAGAAALAKHNDTKRQERDRQK